MEIHFRSYMYATVIITLINILVLLFTSAYSIHWVPSRLLKRLAEKDVPMAEWANYATASRM